MYKRQVRASQSESLLESQLAFLFFKTLNLHILDELALIGPGFMYLFQSKKVLTAHKKDSSPISIFQPGPGFYEL